MEERISYICSMRKAITITTLFLSLALLSNAQTFTQEVTASGGGFYKQINGSLQFTFGEPLTEIYSNSGARLYQGFQQGNYQILGVAEIQSQINVTTTIYPNPSTDFINITVNSTSASKFNYKVVTIEGETLLSASINTGETQKINLTAFAASIYFITVSGNETGYQKTYKITKTP